MKRQKTSRRRHEQEPQGKRLSAREEFFQRIAQDEAAKKELEPEEILELKHKNENQRIALNHLNDANKKVIFLTGSAGTGKSLLAAYRAAKQLKAKKVKKVYLVRPAVSVGKSVGMLPGDIKEKLEPYFAQTLAHLQKFLGEGDMEYYRNKNTIEMKPVEYLRGMSFEDCIVIAEEVQNFTSEEMEMMLTRLGQNCTIIFTGDTKQHDLKGVSGLSQTIELLKKMQCEAPYYLNQADLDELDDGIAIVQFRPEDVVRSGLTRAFVKMYHNN